MVKSLADLDLVFISLINLAEKKQDNAANYTGIDQVVVL